MGFSGTACEDLLVEAHGENEAGRLRAIQGLAFIELIKGGFGFRGLGFRAYKGLGFRNRTRGLQTEIDKRVGKPCLTKTWNKNSPLRAPPSQ